MYGRARGFTHRRPGSLKFCNNGQNSRLNVSFYIRARVTCFTPMLMKRILERKSISFCTGDLRRNFPGDAGI